MSSNSIPTRETAIRTFAAEFNDAWHTFKESDDERAPMYLLLPTGNRANRIFVTGALTDTKLVSDEYWRGRITDPTGTFFVYAGQYQPDALNMLREVEPPVNVAVVGKPRTYETDDGDVNVSIRPESITQIDIDTREKWAANTAKQTLNRIESFKQWQEAKEDDTETATFNEYAQMAANHYDPSITDYQKICLEALEQMNLIDQVGQLSNDPDQQNEENST